jgi:hypothetical protein
VDSGSTPRGVDRAHLLDDVEKAIELSQHALAFGRAEAPGAPGWRCAAMSLECQGHGVDGLKPAVNRGAMRAWPRSAAFAAGDRVLSRLWRSCSQALSGADMQLRRNDHQRLRWPDAPKRCAVPHEDTSCSALSASAISPPTSPSTSGTANTLIYVRDKGIVLDEPSVVAIRHEGGPQGKKTIQAVGHEAKAMLGKVPGNIEAIRPMKDGVIADFTVTEQMLKQFIKMVHPRSRAQAQPAHHHLRALRLHPGRAPRHPRIGARRRRQRRVPDRGTHGRGHRRGPAGVARPRGSMVVDIGGGTTEVGVISLGGMVYKGSRCASAATSSTRPSSTTSAATTAC